MKPVLPCTPGPAHVETHSSDASGLHETCDAAFAAPYETHLSLGKFPGCEGLAGSYHVKTWGHRDAEAVLFPELKQFSLKQAYFDEARFENAFNRLPETQRRAVREWTAIDAGDVALRYRDGKRDDDYESINYQLNQMLASGEALSARDSRAVANIDLALQALPAQQGDFLRVVEHSDARPSPWGSRILPGAVVSSFPCFMSTSVDTTYALGTLLGGELGDPEATNCLALYKIRCDTPFHQGVPLLKHIASMVDEREVLFPRNSCFRVDGIATCTPLAPAAYLPPAAATRAAAAASESSDDCIQCRRVAVLLTAVAPQSRALNLFTGHEVAPCLAR